LIVYNSLKGIYRGRQYGEPKEDYECSNGEGWVQNVVSPVWSDENQPEECTQDSKCSSGKCILTNVTDTDKGTKSCCAWDLYVNIGGTPEQATAVRIPVAFITMADADGLFANSDLEDGVLQAAVYLRPWSYYNPASFLLWALGVVTAAFGAWHGAGDLRKKVQLLDSGEAPNSRIKQPEDDSDDFRDQSMNLTPWHTVGFIVMASGMLVLLYYFDITLLVTVMYCVSCAAAVAMVVLRPLLVRLLGPQAWAPLCPVPAALGGGQLGLADGLALAGGPALAAWWFHVRDTAGYAWALQDLFGCALCVLFLSVIRLPNIKVATALLGMAFCYDIFFVFISPLVFGSSVMVQVATGGEAEADPTYCEKYPDDSKCSSGEQLPMLLLLPRINDFHGGEAMLGLGDIVLPGLLLAFACRYDTGRRLTLRDGGYFPLMVFGYALGLMMADAAVYVMDMGQPALLYLVPCTLGVFCWKARKAGELRAMWEGPGYLDHPAPQGPPALPAVAGSASAELPKQVYTSDRGSEKRPLLAHI